MKPKDQQLEQLAKRYKELHNGPLKAWVLNDLEGHDVLRCHPLWLVDCLKAKAKFTIIGFEFPRKYHQTIGECLAKTLPPEAKDLTKLLRTLDASLRLDWLRPN